MAPPLTEFPRIVAWMDRIAALGHGEPTPLSSKDALAIAREAAPQAQAKADSNDSFARQPGVRVSVTPDDSGKDPVIGEIISISPFEVAIRRVDPLVGEIAVHFPRAGFVIKAEK